MSTDHMFTGKRGEYLLNGYLEGQSITVGDIYKIVHDRLKNCRVWPSRSTFNPAPLGEVTDIDAMCQEVCIEIEKKLGIYPNVPPTILASADLDIVTDKLVADGITPTTTDAEREDAMDKRVTRWYDAANQNWTYK